MLIMTCLLLSGAFLLSGYISNLHSDGHDKSLVASNQQLYAERIARLALALMQETNGQAVKLTISSLQNAIERMDNDHQLLTKGLAQSQSTLGKLYFGDEKLDERVKDYLFNARQVIAAKKRDDQLMMTRTSEVFFSDRPSLFSDKLNQVSEVFAEQAADASNQSLIVNLIVWLLTLAGVWLIFNRGFGPLQKEVTTTVESLEEKNSEALETKRQALELANNKDRYLGSIIEEIRAPINGVLGMVNLLKKTASDEQRRYYAEKIENATLTLSHLTKQVSDFSLAESGALVIEKKEFLILKVIDEVVALLKPRAKNKNLQLFVRVAMDFPEKILGDENQLRQVLFNLLANAIQFTEKGQVTLSVRAEDKTGQSLTMLISVVDTGPGLTELQQERIFHPFEQVSQQQGHTAGGTGLGLTIVKQLLELMGGSIECRSQLGSGTTFTCRLPTAIHTHAKTEVNHQDMVDKLSRLNVLVVDDEPSILEIVSAVLAKVNVQVKTCELAEEAISYVIHEYQQGHEIDIVITDWEMPGMNGEQMATKIIEYLDSAGVAAPKFILLSAFKAGESSSYERTMFSSVIKKPFKVPELINNLMIVSQLDFEDDSEDMVPLLPLSNKRVLLIEDQQVNQVIVSQMLSGYGMLVDLASTGIEGIRKLTDNDYDIVVTDIQLPLMDGIELTENIRAVESWTDIPVIGLSVQHDLALKHRCLNAGMNAFVHKPVDGLQLLDEIVPLVKVERHSRVEKTNQDNAAFDVAQALSRFDGNKQQLSGMIKQFLNHFEGLEQRVHRLHGNDELNELAYYILGLKGVSERLALYQLSHCAETISSSINKNNTDTLAHQLDYLCNVWRDSQDSLNEYLENTNSH